MTNANKTFTLNIEVITKISQLATKEDLSDSEAAEKLLLDGLIHRANCKVKNNE